MSHPDGGIPPRQDGLQLDISKTDTIVCEECGNASFIQAFFLKKVSALVSPTGKEAIIPMQVFSCGNCGAIPKNMLDQQGV
jgi:DNA-directed RNA polymerase subunit RPC12/RpoP|tara:strand:+ start:40 stop:282 length:243 start_codon:yes stop_codon:yes gene_type:complete